MYSATIRCFKNVNKPQQFSIVPSRCIRRVSTAEPLESVNMSYATYENTTAPNNTSPLIVMHGLFGSKSNWKSLCKAIQKKSDPPRKIIAVDARNHGESSHSENHTYAHMAADIRTLYDQLGVKKAVLLGHSMGGRSVMLFTLKYPELVEKLVVVDISPVTTSTSLSSMPEIFRALETVNLPTDVGMSQARSAVDSQLSKSIPDQSLRAFLLTNLIQKQTGSYEWRVNLPALLFNFNNIARFPLISDLQYKGPVLFLGGGKSDYIQISINHLPSRWKSNKIKRATYLPNEENLDLAYASYQSTDNYCQSNPEPTPLLILHGLLASKNNWNSLCKRLNRAKTCKVVAIDARNHGESPHSVHHTHDHLVVDVREIVEKMNLKPVNLIGHSMGGRTAMLYALKYPKLVEKLIVVDASPLSTSPSLKKLPELLQLLQNLKLPENMSLHEVRKVASETLFPMIKNPGLLTFIITNLVQKNNGSYGWRFNVKALSENVDNILKFPDVHNSSYKGPVLFIGGAKSDHIQKSDYPKILELFPNAELKYIDGAGHWLHSEKPEEFLKLTIEFLNKKVDTRIS